MTEREKQKEARRMELMMCGLDMFIKNGYADTKIRDIAQKLNISTGLFFHYFESKEALIEELLTIALSGTMHVKKINCEDPIAYFKNAAETIFNSFKEHPMSVKLFVLILSVYSSSTLSEKSKEILSKINNIESSITIIEKGQQMGIIKKGDSLALSAAFWSSIDGIATTIAMMPQIPVPSADWVVDIIREK